MKVNQTARFKTYRQMLLVLPKIGFLTVNRFNSKNKWGNVLIDCKCDCGKTTTKLFSILNKSGDNISCGCIHKKIVANMGYNNKKYYLNYTKLIDNNYTAYIMGLFGADGYLNKKNGAGISLQQNDLHILEDIKKYLEYTGPVRYKNKGSGHYRLDIIDKPWKNYCINNGIITNKTYDFKVLDKFLYNRHFWRGFIDGDGCILKYNYPNSFLYGINICGTLAVMNSFKTFCESVLNKPININPYKGESIYSFTITGLNSLPILKYLYQDIENELYFKRKFNKYQEILTITNNRKIKNKIAFYKNGHFIKEYDSIKEASIDTNTHRSNIINNCIKNKNSNDNIYFKEYMFKYIKNYS